MKENIRALEDKDFCSGDWQHECDHDGRHCRPPAEAAVL